MQASLPRELRDMIYNYIWSKDDPMPTGVSSTQEECLLETPCPGRPCQCLQNIKLSPWLNPACVGQQTALECVDALYRNSPHFFNSYTPEMVAQKLSGDPFHVGFKPVSVVREMDIHIDIDQCLSKETRSCENGGSYSLRNATAAAAKSLLEIPHKHIVSLNISIEQRCIQFSKLVEVLDILRPMVEVFHKEGARVKLEYYHESKCGWSFLVKDLAKVFECGFEAWQTEFADALTKVRAFHTSSSD